MTVSQTPNLCQVFYEHKDKQYIVRNGHEIARFPAGKENKIKAQWTAIAHDSPALADIAHEMHAEGLADEGRIIRAARLLLEGKIAAHKHDGDFTRATVQASGPNRSPVTGLPNYQVIFNLKWSCDCYDYQRHADDGELQHRCKHSLAVEMAQRLAAREQADFEAAGQREAADKSERRGRRPGHTFNEVPGDGGISDQDLDEPLPAEYQRMLAQEMARRKRIERERGYKWALGNHQPRRKIGSMPVEWQVRGR